MRQFTIQEHLVLILKEKIQTRLTLSHPYKVENKMNCIFASGLFYSYIVSYHDHDHVRVRCAIHIM
jgi:hypothetical protein